MSRHLHAVPAIAPPAPATRVTIEEKTTGVIRTGTVAYSDAEGFELVTERPITLFIPLADVADLHVRPPQEDTPVPQPVMTDRIALVLEWIDSGAAQLPPGAVPGARDFVTELARAVEADWVRADNGMPLRVTGVGRIALRIHQGGQPDEAASR